MQLKPLPVAFRFRVGGKDMQELRLDFNHPDKAGRDAVAAHVSFHLTDGSRAIAKLASDLPPVLAQDVDAVRYTSHSSPVMA